MKILLYGLGLVAAAVVGGIVVKAVADNNDICDKTDNAKEAGVNMLKVAVKFATDHREEIKGVATVIGLGTTILNFKNALKKSKLTPISKKDLDEIRCYLDQIAYSTGTAATCLSMRAEVDYDKCFE